MSISTARWLGLPATSRHQSKRCAAPRGRTAVHVRRALTRQLSMLPAELRRTLTWDQGKEMAEHAQFTIDTQMDLSRLLWKKKNGVTSC